MPSLGIAPSATCSLLWAASKGEGWDLPCYKDSGSWGTPGKMPPYTLVEMQMKTRWTDATKHAPEISIPTLEFDPKSTGRLQQHKIISTCLFTSSNSPSTNSHRNISSSAPKHLHVARLLQFSHVWHNLRRPDILSVHTMTAMARPEGRKPALWTENKAQKKTPQTYLLPQRDKQHKPEMPLGKAEPSTVHTIPATSGKGSETRTMSFNPSEVASQQGPEAPRGLQVPLSLKTEEAMVSSRASP